jgi:ubiquinone/menaquinone biosynthesis C-methylase UbiE
MTNQFSGSAEVSFNQVTNPGIPSYLQSTYWWAYIHPLGVGVFERQWLVNLILWGNYTKLCNAALNSFQPSLSGRTLQIACAYGNLTTRLSKMIADGGELDVIDVLPVQLVNLSSKLPMDTQVKLHCMDSNELNFPGQYFDRALLFFLLHEQPVDVRKKTLAEALRVIRPGGSLCIVDYARPSWFNPLRYVMAPILIMLEPYARDLWKEEIASWLPLDVPVEVVRKHRFFGGLYQLLVLKVN